MVLFIYFDRLGDERQLGDSYHDHVVLYSCSDLVKSEILREDDRPRECSIKTLLNQHPSRIEIDRRLLAIARESEDVAREPDIDISRIYSGDRSYDDDRTECIEDIDRNLSDICLMISLIVHIDIDMMRGICMSISIVV